jgi:hypothetical protein
MPSSKYRVTEGLVSPEEDTVTATESETVGHTKVTHFAPTAQGRSSGRSFFCIFKIINALLSTSKLSYPSICRRS